MTYNNIYHAFPCLCRRSSIKVCQDERRSSQSETSPVLTDRRRITNQNLLRSGIESNPGPSGIVDTDCADNSLAGRIRHTGGIKRYLPEVN